MSLARWLDSVSAEQVVSTLVTLCGDAALFVVDAERTVLAWSRGAERLLGFTASEAVGAHCLRSSRCDDCLKGCGLAERGTLVGVALTLSDSAGQPRRVRKYGRAFYDAAGVFAGGVELLVPEEVADAAGHRSAENSADVAGLDAFDPRVEDFYGLKTRDATMREIFHVVRNVAASDATVLLRGESGTGKELLARAVHSESERRDKPFVAFNCAAMSETLMESQLFGHERGAFTGAVKQYVGLFEQADGGTLFLDEVGEIPLPLQAKLLRVLEERAFFRLGGGVPVKVDVRIIAATNRSLRAEVAAGRFREDLMFRLRVVPVFIPPLRQRGGDVQLLLTHFMNRLSARGHRRVVQIGPDAMRRLLDHRWPGNVRELQNVLEYAYAVGRGAEITINDLPPEFRESTPLGAISSAPQPRSGTREPWAEESNQKKAMQETLSGDTEADAIRRALFRFNGHVGKAAASLGMSRPTFWRKRRKYDIL